MKRLTLYITLIFTFLLGSHEGFVALWTDPGGDPVKVFPYSVSSLPPADQQALKDGITLDSYEELQQLLEDYLS